MIPPTNLSEVCPHRLSIEIDPVEDSNSPVPAFFPLFFLADLEKYLSPLSPRRLLSVPHESSELFLLSPLFGLPSPPPVSAGLF